MFTRFDSLDTFKMKLTVTIIWVIAMAIFFKMISFLNVIEYNIIIHSTIGAVVSFALIAILLRCKVGRWFVLLGIYIFMLQPIWISILPIFIFPEDMVIPIDMKEGLIHLALGAIAIYFFSNREAMEIYYLQPDFMEHIFFLLLSTSMIGIYIYSLENPIIEKITDLLPTII